MEGLTTEVVEEGLEVLAQLDDSIEEVTIKINRLLQCREELRYALGVIVVSDNPTS